VGSSSKYLKQVRVELLGTPTPYPTEKLSETSHRFTKHSDSGSKSIAMNIGFNADIPLDTLPVARDGAAVGVTVTPTESGRCHRASDRPAETS
jgi:hypothetical protein